MTDFEQKYFDDISKIQTVDAEKQLELVKKAQNGNQKARNNIIECNAKFIYSIASRFNYKFLTVSDLFNAGVLGLNRAIDTFKEEIGTVFLTHAVWWIRGYIKKEISDKENTIRIAESANEKHRKDLKKCEAESDLPLDTYNVILMKDIQSFESEIANDNELKYFDVLPDPNAISPEHSAKKVQTKEEIIEQIFGKMENLDRQVLEHIYGINRVKLTMREIAENMSVNVSVIREIRDDAIIKFQELNEFYKFQELYSDFNETFLE